jgi:retron-type reverse transcriptase
MAAGLTARNGADSVRKLQRALHRTSKQDKDTRFYSLYDKGWRTAVLWEAWRHVKANPGAPGGDGQALAARVEPGQEEAMITKLQEALGEKRHQFAPVRLVEMPQPKGGTRPLGLATVEDRVVQTARKLVLAPIFAADFHDGSDGYRPQRDATQASVAMGDDLDHRAWGVVEIDFQSYVPSIPHRKLVRLLPRRIADGSMRQRIKQTRRVGVKGQGPVGPTTVGGPPGSPLSPVYSHIYRNLMAHRWQSRG